MKPLIIFDFDGTLADSIDAFVSSVNAVAVQKGYAETLSAEDLKKYPLEKLVRKSGVSIFKVSSFIDACKEEFHSRSMTLPIHSHIPQLLEMFSKHANMVIVSSNTKENIHSALGNKLAKYFDDIIGTGYFTKARTIKRLRKQYSLKKHHVLYIGDESRDIHAARRAGVDSCAVTWGMQGEQSLLQSRPSMLAQTSTELEHLVKAWIVSRE